MIKLSKIFQLKLCNLRNICHGQKESWYSGMILWMLLPEDWKDGIILMLKLMSDLTEDLRLRATFIDENLEEVLGIIETQFADRLQN